MLTPTEENKKIVDEHLTTVVATLEVRRGVWVTWRHARGWLPQLRTTLCNFVCWNRTATGSQAWVLPVGLCAPTCVQRNALFCAAEVAKIPGLSVNRPEGAMYIMVRLEEGAFPSFATDYDFAQALLLEAGVFVLPGKVRMCPHARMGRWLALTKPAGVPRHSASRCRASSVWLCAHPKTSSAARSPSSPLSARSTTLRRDPTRRAQRREASGPRAAVLLN